MENSPSLALYRHFDPDLNPKTNPNALAEFCRMLRLLRTPEAVAKPCFLLDRIYPRLIVNHPQIVDLIEPMLADYANLIRKEGYTLDGVRSGFHRLITPNKRIDEVRSTFSKLCDSYDMGNSNIWTELARGSDDFDSYVGRMPVNDRAAKILTVDELKYLGEKFLDVGERRLLQYWKGEYHVSDTYLDKGRKVIDFLTDQYRFKISFGQMEKVNDIFTGKIEVTDNSGREIFVFDLGFYTNYQKNRRFGLFVDRASQDGATLVATPEETLIFDREKYPHAKLAEKKDLLMGSNYWEESAVDYDVLADLERTLRALRVKVFYHKEFDGRDKDTIYNSLFVNGPQGWDRITKVLTRAIDYFNEPLENSKEGGRKEESQERKSAQKKYVKETLIMLEADPYLTLLIAGKVPLLQLFPYFMARDNEYLDGLLKSAAFYYQGDAYMPKKQEERGLDDILESRRLWLLEHTSGNGYSGLKLVYDAINGISRDEKRRSLKGKEALFFYSPDNRILGILNFGEQISRDGSLAEISRQYEETFIAIVNKQFATFFNKDSIRINPLGKEYFLGHNIITNIDDAIDYCLQNILFSIIRLGIKTFDLETLFTTLQVHFREKSGLREEVKYRLFAAGFIKPSEGKGYDNAKNWELPTTIELKTLWQRGDDEGKKWSFIEKDYYTYIRGIIIEAAKDTKKVRPKGRSRVKDDEGSPEELAHRYAKEYVKILTTDYYPTASLYLARIAPRSKCDEWLYERHHISQKRLN